ncbi:hypothetical protein FNJ47_39245, partial [Bradyrhizobium sp. UFLA 03-164]|nr:hypothetical protein [Bradyrhizobium uaiense]
GYRRGGPAAAAEVHKRQGIAYLMFAATTLALYLAVLRRIAGSQFVLVLIIFFPTIGINANGASSRLNCGG